MGRNSAQDIKRLIDTAELFVEDTYASPEFKYIDLKGQPVYKEVKRVADDVKGLIVDTDKNGNLIYIETLKGKIKSISAFLAYILDNPSTLFLTFNTYELDVILKEFGESFCTKLVYQGRASHPELAITVWYSINRSITIRRGKRVVRIQSLQDWFQKTTLKAVLEENEIKEDNVIGLTKLAKKLNKECAYILGNNNGDLSAPTVITNTILNKVNYNVDYSKVPLEAIELAYTSFHAPWIEMLRQGHFTDIHDYDLNSAYPTEVADLIDINTGNWVFSDTFQAGATYGFAYAIIQIFSTYITPILMRKEGKLFSVEGTWIGTITKEEIEFIHRHEMGNVIVLGGWWYFTREIIYPFKEEVTKLLKLRAWAKKNNYNLFEYAIKSSTARLAGKFLQKSFNLNDKQTFIAGRYFNPIHATIVMTRVKLSLAEQLFQDREKILAVVIDGVLMDGKARVKTSTKPGELKLSKKGEGVIFSPFTTFLTEHRNPFLAMEIIKLNPYEKWYSLPAVRPERLKLCQAVLDEHFDWTAKVIETSSIIEVGNSNNRFWEDRPQFGIDLLLKQFTSFPHMTEHFHIMLGAADMAKKEKELAFNNLEKKS